MDLRFNEAELAFRDHLRGWLADTLPAQPDRDEWPARRQYDTSWHGGCLTPGTRAWTGRPSTAASVPPDGAKRAWVHETAFGTASDHAVYLASRP